MYLTPIAVSFMVPVLFLHLPSTCMHWQPFLDRPLQLCHRADHKWISTPCGSKERSLVDFIKSILLCVNTYWDVCISPQDFVLNKSWRKRSIYYRPCYHPVLHLSDSDFTLHLQVHLVFQINLTFTHFHLEHFQSQKCPHHRVLVSSVTTFCCSWAKALSRTC